MTATFGLPLNSRLQSLHELARTLGGDLVPAAPPTRVAAWPTARCRRDLPVRKGATVVAAGLLAPHVWAMASFALGAPLRPSLAPAVISQSTPDTPIRVLDRPVR